VQQDNSFLIFFTLLIANDWFAYFKQLVSLLQTFGFLMANELFAYCKRLVSLSLCSKSKANYEVIVNQNYL